MESALMRRSNPILQRDMRLLQEAGRNVSGFAHHEYVRVPAPPPHPQYRRVLRRWPKTIVQFLELQA